MNQRNSQNIYHVRFRCEFDGRKCNSRQKRNNDKCQSVCKKSIKHRTCGENYAWNPNTHGCECDKDCEMVME